MPFADLHHYFKGFLLQHPTFQWPLQCAGCPPPPSSTHLSGWWGWSVWRRRWRPLGSCGEQGQAQEPAGSQWPLAQSLHTVTMPDTISVILSHAARITQNVEHFSEELLICRDFGWANDFSCIFFFSIVKAINKDSVWYAAHFKVNYIAWGLSTLKGRRPTGVSCRLCPWALLSVSCTQTICVGRFGGWLKENRLCYNKDLLLPGEEWGQTWGGGAIRNRRTRALRFEYNK